MTQDHYESIRAIEVRVIALEQAHVSLAQKVDENTNLTSSIKHDTSGLVEFATAANGLVTVAKWIGNFVKWATPIAALAYAAWTYFKTDKL